MYYGLTANKNHIAQIATEVCTFLGQGIHCNAVLFLCEIAAHETHSGMLRDCHTATSGIGLMQIKRASFSKIIARTHQKTWDLISEEFGIEQNISYEMLAYSPLLAMTFARLALKLIPDEFPTNIGDRAKYWKEHYNTDPEAGSVEDFIENCVTHS